MIIPGKVISHGRLGVVTNKLLTIVVFGYLNFGGGPIPPSGGGGDGGYTYSESHDKKILEERRKRIKRDEQEWMLFFKIFTEQCLT